MLFHNRSFILFSTLILTVLSIFIVWQSLNNEPYILFYQSDALVQIGLSSVLLTLWLQLALLVVVGYLKKKLSFFYQIVLLWIIINCFLLGFVMSGYLSDIEGSRNLLCNLS